MSLQWRVRVREKVNIFYHLVYNLNTQTIHDESESAFAIMSNVIAGVCESGTRESFWQGLVGS